MSKFIVRVELHKSKSYTELHAAMKGAGFRRSIEALNGSKYRLPPGVYRLKSDKSTDDVLKLAVDTAKTVDTNVAVIVTRSRGSRFHGLKLLK
jgi:hypothetical protein